jgi:hypothetical protein
MSAAILNFKMAAQIDNFNFRLTTADIASRFQRQYPDFWGWPIEWQCRNRGHVSSGHLGIHRIQ